MPSADIDFTGSDSSGYLTAGTYRARLVSVEERDGKEFPLWSWTFASVEPETFGRKSQITTSLSPKATFFLRQVIEGLGVEVPGCATRVNTEKYIGREAMIFVAADGQFEGRNGVMRDSYKIQRVFPTDDVARGVASYPDAEPLPNEPAMGDDLPL
jgi:hypothetical protein